MLVTATPLILAGDEFGNSQKGNNNVYCQDNEISWLNWNGLQKDREFFEYVKSLIAIRKQYPVFGSKSILTGTDKHGCGVPDISYHGENAWKIDETQKEPYLGIYYHAEDGTDCFMTYNMQECEQEMALPSLRKQKEWHIVFTTADGQTDAEGLTRAIFEENQRKIMVPARTIMLLIGR